MFQHIFSPLKIVSYYWTFKFF